MMSRAQRLYSNSVPFQRHNLGMWLLGKQDAAMNQTVDLLLYLSKHVTLCILGLILKGHNTQHSGHMDQIFSN